MNLILNYHEEFKSNLVVEEHLAHERAHYVFRFRNSQGASIVKSPRSHGIEKDLWELAVIYYYDDDDNDRDYDLDYDTPITDDTLGYLTDDDVNKLLGEIRDLPSRHGES